MTGIPRHSPAGAPGDRLAGLRGRLRLPLIAAPMFLVSGPDLVLAACAAGIGGAFSGAERPQHRGARELAAARNERTRRAGGGRAPVGPWALNLVTHSTYDRLGAELDLVDRLQPPLVITALGSPAPVVERVHAYGGLVIADVNSVALARKAAAAGVDGLALVCAGAGGHTGAHLGLRLRSRGAPLLRRPRIVVGAIGTGGAIRAADCSAPTSSTRERRSLRRAKASRATPIATWSCAPRSRTSCSPAR